MLMSKPLLPVRVSGFSVDNLGNNSIGRSPYFAAFIRGTHGWSGAQHIFRTWNRSAVLSASSEKVMLQSKESCPCTGGDTNLSVDVLCVVADSLLRDKEQFSYLLFGVSAG